MESDNYNLDSTLGGSERLPHAANSLKFTASRSIEIAAMTEAILRPSKTKLIFQSLPVHMRRRVMSHNCKRLPRRLREGHFEQLKKSGLPPKQKRPSRKYRRRPANLRLEYERRQKTKKWLESHIWHAKRFHMTERWGYKLAYAPCDKAFRACYRASSAHCLLQDTSYVECLQITAAISEIEAAFRKLTQPGQGISVHARAYSGGNREGSAHIYKPGTGSRMYIGKVDFLWKPAEASETKRTVWIFIHPAFFSEFREAVEKAFSTEQEDYTVPEKRQKLSAKTIDDSRITELKHKLNRFRLTGPKSHAILVKTLRLIREVKYILKNMWIQKSGKVEDLHLMEKCEYWDTIKDLHSPAELPSRIVIGAVVKDPRLTRPPKRTKARQDQYNVPQSQSLINVPPNLCSSPLWNLSIHEDIISKKWSDTELIKHSTEHQLVPGEIDEDNPEVQNVPIILIQRPGLQSSNKKLGYGSGWDIIVPSGYSLPFWRSFIMFGGRAGGLRETENVARESGQCYLPPDSVAGQNEEQRIYKEMRDRYFRLPPNKRVNYTKLAINSPFCCQWNLLVKEWSGTEEPLSVLRNRDTLRLIQASITKKVAFPLDAIRCYLIPVFVNLTGKGSLSPHAIICLPQEGDNDAPVEPCHKDPREKERKRLRKENKAMLKRLRRLRVKQKKKGAKNARAQPKEGLSEYTQKMRELWLPSHVESVRHSCARQVIGYLSHAGFSFTEASSAGVGYVTAGGLHTLLSAGRNVLLVRNTTSRKYRFVNLNVVLDP